MEGTVLRVADGLVVKVWHSRSAADLQTLATFYDAVYRSGLSLAVPRILEIFALGEHQATLLPELSGEPLWDAPGESPPLDGHHSSAIVRALEALVGVPVAPELATLPVLEDEAPFDPAVGFQESLAGLVHERTARHREVLLAHVPRLDDYVSATRRGLRSLPSVPPALVHGDLVPGNILVVGDVPSALLDFGFLSTIGDPAFDAAVAASVFDMYGPEAERSEAAVDEAVAERFGYGRERIICYRAAYALVTANCFSASGSDGHFDWCVRMLHREEVRDVLRVASAP